MAAVLTKEVEILPANEAMKRKVERILEMSFDHTAAMISLLNAEADEIVATRNDLHTVFSSGRSILRRNISLLKDSLEVLKEGRESSKSIFQRKCQEFGI